MFPLTLLVTILALAAGFVGRGPEREIAATFIAWLYVDLFYHAIFGPMSYTTVDMLHVLLDAVVLAAIFRVMLKANRVWPMFAAAAQLVTMIGHLAAWLAPYGMQRAYWAMTQLPMIAVLVSLIAGSVFHCRRQARLGLYRTWSY